MMKQGVIPSLSRNGEDLKSKSNLIYPGKIKFVGLPA